MSNFEARVQATLDMGKIDADIAKISKKPIRFTNVTIDTAKIQSQVQNALNRPLRLTIGNIDTSRLEGQMAAAGTSAGSSISRSIHQGVSTATRDTSTFTKRFRSEWARAQTALNTNKLDANIQSVKTKFESIQGVNRGVSGELDSNIKRLSELQNEMRTLNTEGSAGAQKFMADYREFQTILASTKNEMSQLASTTQVMTSQSKMAQFMESGTIAAKKYGDRVRELSKDLERLTKSGKVPSSELARINSEFSSITRTAEQSGQYVQTFGSKLKNVFGRLGRYVGVSTLIYGSIRTIKAGINEVVELDNALVDLKKTSDATKGQLDDFYYAANDTAKKLGTSTKDVIQSAADWSRLGYSIKDAETMASVSSIFKSISPGMDIQKANDGLISSMKAFKIEASDALDGVASKINIIGNTQAVSNEDIVDILTRSSSAMAEANNTLDETIALGTAATEITRNADVVGTALKTLSMRIRGGRIIASVHRNMYAIAS